MGKPFDFEEDMEPPKYRRSRPQKTNGLLYVLMGLVMAPCVLCGGCLTVAMIQSNAIQRQQASEERRSPAIVKAEEASKADAPKTPKARSTPNHGEILTVKPALANDGVSFSVESSRLERYVQFIADKQYTAANAMILRGEISLLPSGTKVKARTLSAWTNLVKIDVLDGVHAGESGYIHLHETGIGN